MKNQTEALEHASVKQYCKAVRVPTVGANFISLAEQAVKENHSHIRHLEALLAIECEERDRHDCEPDSRCATAAAENAGRVRLRASAAGSGDQDTRTGRRRLHRAK
jgi:hypothetical protein